MSGSLPTRLAVATLLVAAGASSGCGPKLTCGPGTELDGGFCVAVRVPFTDSGTPSENDSGPVDSGSTDSGPTDSGFTDSGPTDSGLTDSGPADSGPVDACSPYCVGRDCGDDGCGGSCGTCTASSAPMCNTILGQCQSSCTPICNGRVCGDDGCGGSCGVCDGGACNTAGSCVPEAWTCPAAEFNAHDYCRCNCGAPDPDCASDAGFQVVGCQAQQVCNTSGACVSEIPSAWTCSAADYDSHEYCFCNCGAPDPDCNDSSLAVVGCAGSNPVCTSSGTCAVCTPNCTGKVCGDDGCGGSCGTCASDAADSVCQAGVCVNACSPTPIMCQFNECGDNGCGGTCGTCGSNQSCTNGQCITTTHPMQSPNSCYGNCDSVASGGCLCTSNCPDAGNCCSDYATYCICTPDCTGRTCGDNGCGGSCGTCGSGESCSNGQCLSGCMPQCDGLQCGDNGCNGTCGTCSSTSTCSWTQECVPNDWMCDQADYNTGVACSCGCGAPDPDCTNSSLPVLGCPGTSTCNTSGVCDVTFCTANGACSGGNWCTGVYYEGNGAFAGVCGAPAVGGLGEGQSCSFGAECESGVCVGSECRLLCASDTDCDNGEICDGQGVEGGVTNSVDGFIGVCDLIPDYSGSCTSQAACGNLSCIAVMNPTTLAPRFICSEVGSTTLGASCASEACPQGQLCARSASGGPACTLPCPGGASDCPSGWTCGSIPFNSATLLPTADAATVPVCLPQ